MSILDPEEKIDENLQITISKRAFREALDVWTDNTDESEHLFFKESLSYFGIVELNHKLATEWKEKDSELTEMARKTLRWWLN